MKNKNILIFTIGALLILVAAVAYVQVSRPQAGNDAESSISLLPKSSEGAVGIEMEPILKSGSTEVRVSLNTHSGDLGLDLAQAIRLADDRGGVYKAISWDGPPPGGHHISGTLTFPAVDLKAVKLVLTVQSMNGEPEHVFDWDIPRQ